MSASLVGSEMCIRDRRYALHISCKSCPELLGAVRTLRVAPSACSSASVSYTHLTLPTICSV
eukprot:13215255-Alexandrium_andersonii.AAC.1